MEKLLLELLEVNRQILSELRLLRRDLAPQDVERPQAPERLLMPERPQFLEQPHVPERPQAPERFQPAGLESPYPSQTAKTAPARTTAEDLEDIRGALMNGIKQRNKSKSNAFSEFEKRHKDW